MTLDDKDEREYERERNETFHAAALIAYGALQARNTDGSLEQVMRTLDKMLWPEAANPQ